MPPFPYAGEFAGLATAFFFACGATFFTLSSKAAGPRVINRGRLLAACLVLVLLHLLIYGSPLPFAGSERWFWLGLSGVIGFTLGDAALFQGMVLIGTRLTILIFSTAPIFAAVMGYFFLGERLSTIQFLGIAVSLAGVLWVVSEQPTELRSHSERRTYLLGLFFAFLGGLGQAGGAVTAKLGLEGDFPALSAQVIRLLAGTVAIWLLAMLSRQVRWTFRELRNKPRAVGQMLLGVLFGPVAGVWLSLVAIQYSEVGVASTLIAMVPIFLLPIGYFAFRERISLRSTFGTLIAMAGVAILFLA